MSESQSRHFDCWTLLVDKIFNLNDECLWLIVELKDVIVIIIILLTKGLIKHLNWFELSCCVTCSTDRDSGLGFPQLRWFVLLLSVIVLALCLLTWEMCRWCEGVSTGHRYNLNTNTSQLLIDAHWSLALWRGLFQI